MPDQTRMLIVFYSRFGSVEKLALAAAKSAEEAGAAVRVRRAREVADEETMAKGKGWLESAKRQNALYGAPTMDDAEWADAILFGTPCYFGAMATELKNFLDTSWVRSGRRARSPARWGAHSPLRHGRMAARRS